MVNPEPEVIDIADDDEESDSELGLYSPPPTGEDQVSLWYRKLYGSFVSAHIIGTGNADLPDP